LPIHPTAIIDHRAEIDASVDVGPYAVIDANVRVAEGCRVHHHAYLTGWTTIGEHCEIHPGAIIGHAPQDVKYKGERTFLRIGRSNIIREYVTIHRGTAPESSTVIGDGCFLLACCHVAHNCNLGNSVTLINNVLLAGHVTVQDRVTIGGGAVVHQFVRIGELAMISGNARVPMDVPPFAMIDETGCVAGLNRVGLRRAGIAREEAAAIRDAYRTLYGLRLPFREAVNLLTSAATLQPAVAKLIQFLASESKRGIAGSSRSRRSVDPSTDVPGE
jgi:UDP-N-acetylglucosamine acyltransferase